MRKAMAQLDSLIALRRRIEQQERAFSLLHEITNRALAVLDMTVNKQAVLLEAKGVLSRDEFVALSAERAARIAVDTAVEPTADDLVRQLDDFIRGLESEQ
jgi:hypothetical protein